MGIRGLTTLVNRHERKLLQSLCLHNTALVVDGFGLLYYILEETQGADPLSHGGEYELLRSKMTFFFQNMRKCQCRPYVVFDGSFDLDDKKHKTQLERFQQGIRVTRDVHKGCNCMVLPPLALHLMKQVMTELGVCFAFSQFEADREIASLANHWQCPVLGKDSDFYVMDLAGGYIPLTHLRWKNAEQSGHGRFHIPGQIYHLQSFCTFFRVQKDLMPLFATLAGNDYVDPSILNTFISQVYGVHECNSSKRQSQLQHLLDWIGDKGSCSEALDEVWRHIPDKTKIESLVTASMDMYQAKSETTCLKSYFEGGHQQSSELLPSPLCTLIDAPVWVAEAHQSGQMANLCVNILSKQYLFSGVQVENHKLSSAWLPAKFLCAVLSGMILADKLQRKKPGQMANCIVYIRNGDGFQRLKVSPVVDLDGYGRVPSLSQIPVLPQEAKRHLLIRVLSPGLCRSEDLDSFHSDFQLALLATLYWINSGESRLTELHISVLLIGWLQLFAQRQSRRHRRRGGRASSPTADSETESERFKIEAEVVTANINLNPKRVRVSKPDPVISHGFAQWQHCVLYAFHLNELLQMPLPPCTDISVLFSGLNMHNLYSVLKGVQGKTSLQHWIPSNFFRNAPRALQVYESMRQFLSAHAREEARVSIITNRKTGRSHKRNRQRSTGESTGACAVDVGRGEDWDAEVEPRSGLGSDNDDDDDDGWMSSNRYAALCN
ncbi:single-strand DNA endonuclease ASTE1-like [Diadema setosum]|uniref:single-strand DNA endonuclease ASTE1-like n=1 Tax=Diadema setosum TaxID=31175 RepID=UPI003B3BC30E